jgi:hypothetical protein
MGKEWVSKHNLNFKSRGEKRQKVVTAFLTIILIFLSSLIVLNTSGTTLPTRSSRAEVEFLDIDVVIDNNYAATNIQEKFTNPYNYPIDKTFSFQIPSKAFISNFSLTIDNETLYAEIVGNSEAKEKYNEAVVKGSNAGIVESMDKNTFSYSVSISPRSDLIVCLRYEQFLEKSLGRYEYKLPLKDSSIGSFIRKTYIDVFVKSKFSINSLSVDNYNNINISNISTNKVHVSYNTTFSVPKNDFIVNYELASPPINGTMLNYNDDELKILLILLCSIAQLTYITQN